MEAFYEGETKEGDDRKEEGKKVKPWGFLWLHRSTEWLYCLLEETTFSGHIPHKPPEVM